MKIVIQIERTRNDLPDDLIAQTIAMEIKESDIWMDRTDFIRQYVEPMIADLLYRLRNAWPRFR